MGVTHEIQEIPLASSLGLFEHIKQRISLDDGLKGEQKYVTLLHESLHAIFSLLGQYRVGEDESVVQGLALALYNFIRDNKGVVAEIQAVSLKTSAK